MIFKTGQHFLALNDTEVGIDIISLVSNQEREREREKEGERKEREREPFYRDGDLKWLKGKYD